VYLAFQFRGLHDFSEKRPSSLEIQRRAAALAEIVAHCDMGDGDDFPEYALIDGDPWLMAPLERELFRQGIQPVYAYSRNTEVG
jgi:hypothetical protein